MIYVFPYDWIRLLFCGNAIWPPNFNLRIWLFNINNHIISLIPACPSHWWQCHKREPKRPPPTLQYKSRVMLPFAYGVTMGRLCTRQSSWLSIHSGGVADLIMIIRGKSERSKSDYKSSISPWNLTGFNFQGDWVTWMSHCRNMGKMDDYWRNARIMALYLWDVLKYKWWQFVFTVVLVP